MFTMHNEAVFSISDLRYISIDCPHCHTKVILDMQQKTAFAEKHGFFAPQKCPGCDVAYDSAMQPNIDALQKAYVSLVRLADRISFRSADAALEAGAKK